MTPAQRTARACRITAIGLTAGACYGATQHWVYGLPGVISASVFLAIAQSYSAEDRRRHVRQEELRRAAIVGRQSLRPAAPLSDQERTAFDQITTHYDQGTAA